MSSVSVVCWIFLQTFQTYFSIQANSVDPDQTAPRGAVWSGSTLFAKWILKSQADDKGDDNCCDWHFKGLDAELRVLDILSGEKHFAKFVYSPFWKDYILKRKNFLHVGANSKSYRNLLIESQKPQKLT